MALLIVNDFYNAGTGVVGLDIFNGQDVVAGNVLIDNSINDINYSKMLVGDQTLETVVGKLSSGLTKIQGNVYLPDYSSGFAYINGTLLETTTTFSNIVIINPNIHSNINMRGYDIYGCNVIYSNLIGTSASLSTITTGSETINTLLTMNGPINSYSNPITIYDSPTSEYIQISSVKTIYTGGATKNFIIDGQLSNHQYIIKNYSSLYIDTPVVLNNKNITGVSTISATTANIGGATIGNLISTTANITNSTINNLIAPVLSSTTANITNSTINNLIAPVLSSTTANITNSTINSLVCPTITITTGNISTANVNNMTVSNLIATTANITNSTINALICPTANITNSTITNIRGTTGNIATCDIATLNAGIINATGTSFLQQIFASYLDLTGGISSTPYINYSTGVSLRYNNTQVAKTNSTGLSVDYILPIVNTFITLCNSSYGLISNASYNTFNSNATFLGNISVSGPTTLNNTTITGNLSISGSGSIGNISTINNSSGNISYQVPTGYSHLFKVNGITYLNISSASSTFSNTIFSPYLGVNTSSITAGYTLDCNGTIRATAFNCFGPITSYNPSNTAQYIQLNGQTVYTGSTSTIWDGQTNSYSIYFQRYNYLWIQTASNTNGSTYFATTAGYNSTMICSISGDAQNSITYPFGGVDSTGTKLNGQLWINSNAQNLAGVYTRLALGYDGSLDCGTIQAYRYASGPKVLRINPGGGRVHIGYGDSTGASWYRDMSWQAGSTFSAGIGETPVMASGRGASDTTIPYYWFPNQNQYVRSEEHTSELQSH